MVHRNGRTKPRDVPDGDVAPLCRKGVIDDQTYLAASVIAEFPTPDGAFVLVRLACWPDQPGLLVRADALVQ